MDLGFPLAVEWIGIGYCEHPSGAVAVYLIPCHLSKCFNQDYRKEDSQVCDETTIKEHSDWLRVEEIEANLCRHTGK